LEGPLAPGERRKIRAPLLTASLIAGLALCALAAVAASMRQLTQDLAHTPLVMRALGATIAMSGVMLGRVALAASVGLRRAAALLISTPMVVLGAALIAVPSIAAIPYDKGWALVVPWVIGLPGILALMLSRWRA
jgi:hypothetical protein